MKRLNINSTVQIPATKDVLTFLRSENTQFWQDHVVKNGSTPDVVASAKKRIEEYKDPEIKDGMITMQLWVAMNTFGPTMSLGVTPLFTNILINEKDLK
ncbi:hypothetical protein vBSenE22_042 [Salmonella phage vB_Sen-E22]|uniref:Uncharacterized protein n=1 Tax=Salmonella phage vB_Sen-E22 TaxID=2768772 RepID=A0A7M3TH45_9CAUD|nr:hypothetical protein vBSenE22_042 [Salmonella phage vB_Sen-E22]